MKNISILIILMGSGFQIFGQNAGIGTPTPDPSALLDISSTSKGLLIPRMDSVSLLAIPSPPKGLLVFDSVTNQLKLNTGTAIFPRWLALGGNSGWNLKGNMNTDPATNFIGTTDNKPVLFKVNSQWSGIIDSASETTSLGYQTGKNNSQTFGNTVFGSSALIHDITNEGCNTALGFQALLSNGTGYRNTAVGYNALDQNETGIGNVAIGSNAMLTSASSYNTAIGRNALSYSLDGSYGRTFDYNTAIGSGAMTPLSGSFNTSLRSVAGGSGSGNTVGGALAMSKLAGSYNTVYGDFALAFISSGDYNTVLGNESMSSGRGLEGKVSQSTAIGYGTLIITDGAVKPPAVTGDGNTAIGYNAGSYSHNGQYNVFVGANVEVTNGNCFNSVVIGQATTTAVSNSVMVGNGATSSIGGPVDWTVLSDGRVKKNVKKVSIGLSFISKLRPVTYTISPGILDSIRHTGMPQNTKSEVRALPDAMAAAYKAKEKILYSGFVAQEVEQIARTANPEFDGVDAPKSANDLYALRYESFVMPLVTSVQELASRNVELISNTAALKSAYQNINDRLNALERKLK